MVPFLAHIDQDQDVAVRNSATGLLIELCLNCDTKRCLELLDILEKVNLAPIVKHFTNIIVLWYLVLLVYLTNHLIMLVSLIFIWQILNRPFELQSTPGFSSVFTESDLSDNVSAAKGIVKIFIAKMYQLPSVHSIRAYKILVNHLDMHYKSQSLLDQHRAIRYVVSVLLSSKMADLWICLSFAEF